MVQKHKKGEELELTNGWINGLFVALRTLVIGSPREGSGYLVPSLAILCDRFDESGILLGSPATYAEFR